MEDPNKHLSSLDTNFFAQRNFTYKKRTRTIMTPTQNEMLMRFFVLDPFPPTEIREDLARSLRIKPRTVQIWFQNQRQKSKQRSDGSGIDSKAPIVHYSIPNSVGFKSRLDILADIAYEEYCRMSLNRTEKCN